VPKIFLVAQQAEAIREWVGKVDLVVAEYYGKLSFPEIGSFDVLVSTPEAFRMRQKTKEGLRWSSICLLVFDEVHHVLKDDPYRKIHLISSATAVLGAWALRCRLLASPQCSLMQSPQPRSKHLKKGYVRN